MPKGPKPSDQAAEHKAIEDARKREDQAYREKVTQDTREHAEAVAQDVKHIAGKPDPQKPKEPFK